MPSSLAVSLPFPLPLSHLGTLAPPPSYTHNPITKTRTNTHTLIHTDVHAYERSHPVANKQVVADGQGMVHFNIGDAGAGLYTKWLPTPAWSAYHSAQFGHGELVISNATTAFWSWHRNSDDEKTVTDSYVLVNTHTA